MSYTLLNIGYGSSVVADEVIAILAPNSAPMRRLRDEAKDEKKLIDATHGRKTRSIIIMKNNHIVLSAAQTDTIAQRYAALNEEK
ncbi:MAG: DUF370 domain-containing protein [Desulfobacteraceae bacterium]|nr:DUF370 domain-containing protein [Desulfobacteraceae bacterium]MBC2754556.1 DUF370 domain-containing protein [Desulfobacteraceae bacterium]MBC2763779.1 DUF370 domain-containing protein [ANME-2 cluster archaeon]